MSKIKEYLRQFKLKDFWLKILSHSVTRNVAIITALTFLSKFLGFARHFFILENLQKLDSDLLLSADIIPRNISDFLLRGTVYSSVLPVVVRLNKDKEDNDLTSMYLNIILLCLGGFILLLVGFGVFFTENLVNLLTSPDLVAEFKEAGKYSEYLRVIRILFIVPLVFAIQTIFGVFLTYKKRFLTYSMAGVISSISSIIALTVSRGSATTVAIGMVSGWVIADLLYLFVSFRSGYSLSVINLKKIKQRWNFIKDAVRSTFTVFLPRILLIDSIFVSILLINFYTDNQGQVTAFEIATAIQITFYVVVISLNTVLFPNLSKILQSQNSEFFWSKFTKYTRINLGLGLLTSFLTFLVAPVVMYLYGVLGKGQGNNDYIVMLAQIAAISLIFRTVREIWSKYFYVKERTWQPIILSFAGISAAVLGMYFMVENGLDVAVSGSISLITYNIAWIIVAWYFIRKDRIQDMTNLKK